VFKSRVFSLLLLRCHPRRPSKARKAPSAQKAQKHPMASFAQNNNNNNNSQKRVEGFGVERSRASTKGVRRRRDNPSLNGCKSLSPNPVGRVINSETVTVNRERMQKSDGGVNTKDITIETSSKSGSTAVAVAAAMGVVATATTVQRRR